MVQHREFGAAGAVGIELPKKAAEALGCWIRNMPLIVRTLPVSGEATRDRQRRRRITPA